MYNSVETYSDTGVATISRLFKIIGLFCRILFLLQGSSAKETYDFKEPANRSHPIPYMRRQERRIGQARMYGVKTSSIFSCEMWYLHPINLQEMLYC